MGCLSLTAFQWLHRNSHRWTKCSQTAGWQLLCAYMAIQWWFFHPFVSQAHEKTHRAFFLLAHPPQAPFLPSGKSHHNGSCSAGTALNLVWAHRSTLQTKSRVLGTAPTFWTHHTSFAQLFYIGTVAIPMGFGTSAWQLEVQGGCLPSSFCDSTKFLGGRRYIWTCDSPAFGWDVEHTETVADFNCYVSVENRFS